MSPTLRKSLLLLLLLALSSNSLAEMVTCRWRSSPRAETGPRPRGAPLQLRLPWFDRFWGRPKRPAKTEWGISTWDYME